MELGKFIRSLGRIYPKRNQEEWDYSGYQAGEKDFKREVKKVLLVLDFYEDVDKIIAREKPDLVLTHHPFIFGRKKDVLLSDEKKKELYEKVMNTYQFPIYSFHTNYDRSNGGMNDVMIKMLGIDEYEVASDTYMRFGKYKEPKKIEEVIDIIKKNFNLNHVSYNKVTEKVKSLGVIGGSGSSFFYEALKLNLDLFITGDSSHHSRLDMKRYGLNFIELPHECEELAFFIGMEKAIHSISSDIQIKRLPLQKSMEIM